MPIRWRYYVAYDMYPLWIKIFKTISTGSNYKICYHIRGDKEGFYEFIWSAEALFTTGMHNRIIEDK